ncbi:MAG TPA: nuclear transport factor 2 family protein [Solirubrobacteraceae bacterium]|nr:nuclear transport factor 2 family protein [Solirubrobacteraceae bacterium]
MADDPTLIARLQRLEDLAEIERLFYEYRRHLDARDMHAYSRLFCTDGEWTGRTGSAVGPDGIQAMLEANLSPNPAPPGATSWHIVSNPLIDLDGDSATASTTWSLIRRADGDEPKVVLLGHYDDVLAREDGRWKFKRRRAHIDIPHQPA